MKLFTPNSLFQHLLKLKAGERGRLLGLNVTEKSLALALSDTDLQLAKPLSFIDRDTQNMDMIAGDLRKLISKHVLTGFVVGCHFDRVMLENNPNAVEAKGFVYDLCKTGKFEDVPYAYWDNNFSKEISERMLKPLNLQPSDQERMSEKFAVVGVLQDYLDFMNDEFETKQS